jgi:hypothetical protein
VYDDQLAPERSGNLGCGAQRPRRMG